MSALSTTEIVNKFVEIVDTDKEYTIDELTQLLNTAYGNDIKVVKKNKTEKKPRSISPKKDKKVKEVKEIKEEKKKRAPSAYNNYVKQRIISLKQEQQDTPAKELLGIAAAEWKTLTDDEKAGYKSA